MAATADDTRHAVEHLAGLGFTLATPDEIAVGRDIAARVLGPAVAAVETLRAVQNRTGGSAFVYRGEDGGLAGVLCFIPLTPAAAPALAAGMFDGIEPPLAMAARPGDRVIAVYG